MENVTRKPALDGRGKDLEKRKAGLAGAAARWRKVKKAERSAMMRALAARRIQPRGGRPVNPDRCPCGAMTRARALKRNHKCVAPAPGPGVGRL